VLASASADQTARLWDAERGPPVYTLRGHRGVVNAAVFSPPATSPPLLASAGADQTVRLWNTVTGRPLKPLRGHTGFVYALAAAPAGAPPDAGRPARRGRASGGADGTGRLWDLARGKGGRPLAGHKGRVFCVACSPDGKWLASGGLDRTTRLWDVETGKAL